MIKISEIFEFLKKNIVYTIGITLLIILSIFVLITLPHGTEFPELKDDFFLLGLGLNSSILIISIGSYLLYRWVKGGRENSSQLVWGVCWLLYSWTFIAHILRAFGIPWANENLSTGNFFLFRWVMIIFAAGIYYGISLVLTENRKLQIIPTVIILGIGFLWFAIGLFVLNSTENMMYIFLFCIWSPILFSLAYTFYLYGRNSTLRSPYLIALGFFGVAVTYLAWAPWHFADVIYLYFIWYFLFQLSLVPILMGFLLLTAESARK